MMVRLAFSVAVSADPEILIIDEALSVGDELFQRKCFSRIEAIRANGSTILFVSHAGGTVVELCDRAVLIDGGEKLAIGAPKQIVGSYKKLLYAPQDKRALVRETIREAGKEFASTAKTSFDDVSDDEPLSSGDEEDSREYFDPNLKPTSTIEYVSQGAFIDSPAVLTTLGELANNLVRGRIYCYTYKVRFVTSAKNVSFGMLIKTTSGVELGGGVSASSALRSLSFVAAGSVYLVKFHFRCALNPGVYFLNAGVAGYVDDSETYLHRLIDVAMFKVLPETESLATGLVDFDCYPEFRLEPSLSMQT
jgi:lipopolysaccharide transport system ATP-binding protein